MESSVTSTEPPLAMDGPPDTDIEVKSDKPLNAEEATVIVLKFLRRMGKNVISPRSANLQGNAFVVEVELKKALATVQVDSKTREVIEYSIKSEAGEAKLRPILSKNLLIMIAMAASILGVYTLTVFNILKIPVGGTSSNGFLSVVAGSGDILIFVGICLIPVVVIVWWRRRSR